MRIDVFRRGRVHALKRTQKPLHIVPRYGFSSALIGLHDSNVIVNCVDWASRVPLSYAAEHGHEAIVKLLWNRDDVAADSKDINGRTPLSWAAGNGHEIVVKLLLSRDDVIADSPHKNGRTPLFYAALYGHEKTMKTLLKRSADAKSRNITKTHLYLW
jgi:ankyrin repeat protein